MGVAAAVVMAASALFVGLALLALLGRGARPRLAGAWIAMVGFAGLAAFCFWRGVELRKSAAPVYHDLPSGPGEQQVTLVKSAVSPGYRVRLVRRDGRTFDPELSEKLRDGHFRITVGSEQSPFCHVFDREGVLEFDSDLPSVALRFDAAPALKPSLDAAAVELRVLPGAMKGLEQARSTLSFRTAFFLGGLLLAGLAASTQRRKLRTTTARPADPPDRSAGTPE